MECHSNGKLSSVKKIEGSTVTNESYSYNAFKWSSKTCFGKLNLSSEQMRAGFPLNFKKVTNGEEERYLVDEYTSYSRVLEEKNKNNNLTATYTYGHDLISQDRKSVV